MTKLFSVSLWKMNRLLSSKKKKNILYIVFICFAKKSNYEIKFNIRRRIVKYKSKTARKII